MECKNDGEPVTMAEAEEMAEMEIKAQKTALKVNDNVKEKTRKPRVPIVSDEKKVIFSDILAVLSEKYDVSVEKDNKKLRILLNNRSFTVDLVENRPKKA